MTHSLANPESDPTSTFDITDEHKKELADYATKMAEVAPVLQKSLKDIQREPNDITALNKIGESNLYVGDKGEALSAFSAANAASPNWQSAQGLGGTYLALGDNKEARNAFTEAHKMNGDEPLPIANLAYLDIQDGDAKEARNKIDELKTKFPDYEYGYKLSAQQNYAQGRMGAKE